VQSARLHGAHRTDGLKGDGGVNKVRGMTEEPQMEG
jgi:hypothetical protein